VALIIEDHWVWDSWYSSEPIDGLWHGYFLMAPKNDVDPELRHSQARVGHATSPDLFNWKIHGPVISPGEVGAWNDNAIWTGCLVRAVDGTYSNFYTSTNRSRESAGIQRIGRVVGLDPFSFQQTDLVLEADSKYYERLNPTAIEASKLANGWKEEAWRDPWVFLDERDGNWHMLVTARGKTGPSKNRGVIGHAISKNLNDWEVQPPLVESSQFGHMEVFQLVETPTGWVLVFSTGAGDIDPECGLAPITGTYSAPADSPTGPFHLEKAELIDDGTHYAGRVVLDTDGEFKLLGFQNGGEAGFTGIIGDPLPLRVSKRGTLQAI
jgi:beta-fructofuranosidase